jgi:hypothetical protein
MRKEWKTFGYERWMEAATQAHQAGTAVEQFDAMRLCTRFLLYIHLTRDQPTSIKAVGYFSHTHWHSRGAATEKFAPSGGSLPWRGHLHLSGVDHILDKAWMAWRSPNVVSK